ncbi:pyridoxamine 5'-phosphate oxidase family protein [Oceanicoccus sagamiensis]|uniref:Cytosolic protein n=1 Tax=Oceanicoccus sagamiensis TaxID=716816 RepID=A0A1X9NBS3_9GAMM|nr:pyridoxamine 5'-phosphate oxidase family protein [Oceanicoccus sagamiensis]ARN75480.1 cytosolic protein [Oceanicoccus sagamiensis]
MKEKVASLLREQVQCVLATQGEQEIALHLMAYAFSPDLAQVYLASLEPTQKVKNMRGNPAVTLHWDNRTGNNADHSKGFAVSAFGRSNELKADAAQSATALLRNRNATLSALLDNAQAVVFAIDIHRYQWVEGYTESMVYKPHNP